MYAHLNQIGWKHVRIVLIEAFPCHNKQELLRQEQHYIDELQPTLNKIAALTPPCPHGSRHRRCRDCSGPGICEHDIRKARCKECSGSSVCGHNTRKSRCKECRPILCDYCQQTYAKGRIIRHYQSKGHKKAYTQAYVDAFGELPTKFPFKDLVH